MRVLIDTNVILDFVLNRVPFADGATALFQHIEKQSKQERTVIHLYLKETDTHLYFGSMANIFEFFGKEDIGIRFGSLRNFGLSLNKPYENSNVIIRKGILQAKPKQKKLKEVIKFSAF